MTERRYTDEEVTAIFSAAAEAPQATPHPAARQEGLTLADLQDIGREVGMSPEALAQAARTLELRGQAATRTLRSSGSLREWTNGNLQALLEPTGTGHRLRLRTLKGNALAFIGAGLATIGAGAAVAISSALGGQLGHAVPGIALLAIAGAGMFAVGALGVPGWARLRARQMEGIATRLALPPAPRPGGG